MDSKRQGKKRLIKQLAKSLGYEHVFLQKEGEPVNTAINQKGEHVELEKL